MNEETFKALARYEQHRARLARERFYQNPQCEAEAIGKHYVAHATMALQLLEAVKIRQEAMFFQLDTTQADQFILYLVKEIKRNHLNDFGIPLEWHPNAEKV